MPDYAKLIEQETKRREPWQQRPEFKEWMAGMEKGLDHFFNHLVPDMPDDPYSVEGLRHAEATLLRLFPDGAAMSEETNPADGPAVDAFLRYLGQVYVARLEGRWMWMDMTDEGDFRPIIRLPCYPHDRYVAQLLADAADLRTGDRLATSFETDLGEYQDWQRAGRPGPNEWAPMRRKLRRERRGR